MTLTCTRMIIIIVIIITINSTTAWLLSSWLLFFHATFFHSLQPTPATFFSSILFGFFHSSFFHPNLEHRSLHSTFLTPCFYFIHHLPLLFLLLLPPLLLFHVLMMFSVHFCNRSCKQRIVSSVLFSRLLTVSSLIHLASTDPHSLSPSFDLLRSICPCPRPHQEYTLTFVDGMIFVHLHLDLFVHVIHLRSSFFLRAFQKHFLPACTAFFPLFRSIESFQFYCTFVNNRSID